jgi:hypothetical protein
MGIVQKCGTGGAEALRAERLSSIPVRALRARVNVASGSGGSKLRSRDWRSHLPSPEQYEVYREPSPFVKHILPMLDGKLSSRLLGDNLWLARVKLRVVSRELVKDADLDAVIKRVVEIHQAGGAPIYATLRAKDLELRIIVDSDKVGVALVARSGGLTGRAALDAAATLPRGRASIYKLRGPLPE